MNGRHSLTYLLQRLTKKGVPPYQRKQPEKVIDWSAIRTRASCESRIRPIEWGRYFLESTALDHSAIQPLDWMR